MKKFINLISCISIIGLPIITSSCSKNIVQEELAINLNNYTLTDNVYEFHSNLADLKQQSDEIMNEDGSISYIPFIFSSWVRNDYEPMYQDNMQVLKNVREYLNFQEPINSDRVYNASLWLDPSKFSFSNGYWKKLIDRRFSYPLHFKLFRFYEREFYIKKGFPEIVIDKIRDENYENSDDEFYNYNSDTNTFETLSTVNYYEFLQEQKYKKNVDEKRVAVSLYYNFAYTEPGIIEQSFRIYFEPIKKSGFTWHNGSTNPIAFLFDSNKI